MGSTDIIDNAESTTEENNTNDDVECMTEENRGRSHSAQNVILPKAESLTVIYLGTVDIFFRFVQHWTLETRFERCICRW